MNKSLFNYVLILSLVALSSSLYGAQVADTHKKQVVLHPRVVRYLNMLSPLAPYTRERLHREDVVSGSVELRLGYKRPILCDYVAGDGHFQEVHELLAVGADVNATDSDGNTAITMSLDKPLQLQLLLDYKADPNVLVNFTGNEINTKTLLSSCCSLINAYKEDEHRESLGILLNDPRIRVNDRDANGATPLFIVISRLKSEEELPFIQRLIECGANPMYKPVGKSSVFNRLVKRASRDSQQASLCKAVLQLFDEQRKAEGTWPKAGVLPTIQKCEILPHALESLVVEYVGLPPSFVSNPRYQKKLDAAIEAVAKCSAAS